MNEKKIESYIVLLIMFIVIGPVLTATGIDFLTSGLIGQLIEAMKDPLIAFGLWIATIIGIEWAFGR